MTELNIKYPKPLEQMTDEEIATCVRLNHEIDKKHVAAQALPGLKLKCTLERKNLTSARREDANLHVLISKLREFISKNQRLASLSLYCYDDGEGVGISLQDFLDTAIGHKQRLAEAMVLRKQEIERLERKIKELKQHS